MIRLATLALLLSGTAVPAGAAENIDCIAAQLTAEQNADVGPLVPQGVPPPPWLTSALGTCTQRNGWSEDAQAAALNHLLGTSWQASILADPPMTSDEVARLAAAIATIPEATQRGWYDTGITPAGEALLSEAFISAGLDLTGQPREAFIAYYLLSGHMIRFGAADFAAAP